MSDQRISTGIAGLDRLLHGGLIRGRTYLLCGDTGTGKTLVCLQLLQQALSRGEKAIYVTVDERPSELTDSASVFSWNLQQHIQEKNLAILDASPYFSGRSATSSEKGVDPQKVVADLSNYVKRLGATLLFIDPVTPFILAPDASSPTQDQARSLMNLIQAQMNTTNLLTAHCSARSKQDPTCGVEEFLAAGSFMLEVQRVGESFHRSLTIRKMRGTPVHPGEHRFEISSAEGIVLREHDAADAAKPPAFDYFQLPGKSLKGD